MDRQLFKIANMLTLHLHEMEGVGLIDGKMGAALFYYECSRYTGVRTFNDIADDLLDDVLCNSGSIDAVGIEQGFAGIGWGINYLIRNSFVDASNDLLIDLEQQLFSKDDVNFGVHFSTLSSAIYLLSKSGGKCMLEKYDKWVERLLNACTYYCLNIYDNKKKPLDLINSMLYFLIELKKANVHIREVSKLIWKILNYLLSYDGLDKDIHGDSAILMSLLGQLDDSTPLKKDVIAKLREAKKSDWNVGALKKILWQQILFSCRIKNGITLADVDRLLFSVDNNVLDMKEILIPLGLYLIKIDKSE